MIRSGKMNPASAPLMAVLLWLVVAAGALGQVQEPVKESRAALFDALGIPALLEVMRHEGQSYGNELGADFLPDGGGAT